MTNIELYVSELEKVKTKFEALTPEQIEKHKVLVQENLTLIRWILVNPEKNLVAMFSVISKLIGCDPNLLDAIESQASLFRLFYLLEKDN